MTTTLHRPEAGTPRRGAALALVVLLLLAGSATAQRGAAMTLTPGYAGSYAQQRTTPGGGGLDRLLPLDGVIEIRRSGNDLHLTGPDGRVVRFVPAGTDRFVAPALGSILRFDVDAATRRVLGAVLESESLTVLTPVRAWQGALLRLGHLLTRAWDGAGGVGWR
jgi:hypothetical protein